MAFPVMRPRRMRETENLRRLIRETELGPRNLIYPMFAIGGEKVKNPVNSMPGVAQLSVDYIVQEAKEAAALKLGGIILFGIPDHKDDAASSAYEDNGIVQRAIRAVKKEVPELLVITDVCLCHYTSTGHCGVVENGHILNDPSVELLQKTALSHVKAGADMVAPSDMMDGRIGAIRQTLDANGYSHIPIMSYAAKYSSAFYGPFRDAAHSTPQFGDRRSYQMDPANSEEALRETWLDIEEGADIVMVKPAMAYMDIIRRIKDEFSYPVAAYNVSGEYSMIKAAAANGWIDEKKVVLELMTGFRRAGADLILTYHAKDIARWLKEE